RQIGLRRQHGIGEPGIEPGADLPDGRDGRTARGLRRGTGVRDGGRGGFRGGGRGRGRDRFRAWTRGGVRGGVLGGAGRGAHAWSSAGVPSGRRTRNGPRARASIGSRWKVARASRGLQTTGSSRPLKEVFRTTEVPLRSPTS